FAYGVGGKVKGESTTSFPGGSVTRNRDANVKFTNDAEVGDIGDDIVMGEYLAQPWKRNCFKPFDVGANIMLGYEFSSKLSASLVAQFGLTDITSKVEGNEIEKSGTKNIGFGISLGYRMF
ncbi:MAG: hypothetical protein PHP31_09495, partial [Lentimicrobiaceae bacterium]|nr:hypothetical protein [Lentimicrobiaceae bacterium]